MMSSETENTYSISNKQFSNYFAFFHEILPLEEGHLSGSRAREFFLLSNLPTDTLSHIWKLSDVDRDGQLNVVEFAVCLHLTQLTLEGVPLPLSLPSELESFVHKVTHPEEYLIPAKTNQVLKCQSAFLSFCENISNNGYLTAEAARYLLTNSQLSKGHLFHIWTLADADKDGRLSFQEFVVAMHLIFVAKLDQPLPYTIQNINLFPDEFNLTAKKISAQVSEKPSNSQAPPPPLIPQFVLPIDNPFINPLFKSIPPERFRNEKFDTFMGDPFISARLNHSTQLSDSSNSLRSSPPPIPRLSHSESAEINKLPSSHSSSVKSLVEERDQPKMMKAESIELEESKLLSSPPPPTSPLIVSSPQVTTPTNTTTPTRDMPIEPPPTQPNDDTPPPLPPPPHPSDLLSSDEEEVDEEATKAELDKISQQSTKFLSQSGGGPPIRKPYKDPYANAPEMKTASQKGLTATINDIAPEKTTPSNNRDTPTNNRDVPTNNKYMPTNNRDTPTNNSHTGQNGSQSGLDDFLSQLDDLEAEIMNVLDDTNSFDPLAAPPPPTKPSPPLLPVTVTKPPTHTDEIDSPNNKRGVNNDSSNNKRITGPSPILLRGNRSGSARTSSDSSSSEPSPAPRRYTVAASPIRKKIVQQNANRNSAILDDLDDLFSAELASIDTFLETKQTQEKQAEERIRRETMDVKRMEKKAMETPELSRPTVASVEELARRREEERARKEKEWTEEFKRIEKDAQKQYEESKKVKMTDEEAVKELEAEWEALLEQESKNMKEAWVIRAQREEEEERRKEEMKKKILEERKGEVTIEEWIKVMEENKMKEMTPEEREKYEQRKKAWLEKRRQKEEKHKREMEEKLQRNRERMAAEYMRVRDTEEEVKQNRLDSEQLKQIEEEQLKREAEDRRQRTESAKIKKQEFKIKEIEESKPKARSALAARWEQQVKGRDKKDFRSTVLTGSPVKETTSNSKEAERLARRVGKLT